jgi:pimeloyl-ACP methyl ester carboxylesterase
LPGKEKDYLGRLLDGRISKRTPRMMTGMRQGFIDLGDQRLESRLAGPEPSDAPMLVMLHEGLGCAALWGKLPALLAEATGLTVLAYSRAGHGASVPAELPDQFRFMHDEALKVLPRVLEHVGFRRGVLVGASDGATIAAIYAGSIADERVCGISLTAPHFIVEEETAAGARAGRIAYETGGLKVRLARWHRNVDIAFYTWNQAFASPEFKQWFDATPLLRNIRVPVQVLQGEKDEYGTPEQLAIARRECPGPVQTHLLPGIGHSIHKEAPDLMCRVISEFVTKALS